MSFTLLSPIVQVSQLNTLITHLLGDLTKGDRQKIMTICTIDVHARDVVQKLISQKVENAQAFLWLSQLRHRYCTPRNIQSTENNWYFIQTYMYTNLDCISPGCRWDDEKKHCFANICDAEFMYSYEYLGNTPRLVITPLTDRYMAELVHTIESHSTPDLLFMYVCMSSLFALPPRILTKVECLTISPSLSYHKAAYSTLSLVSSQRTHSGTAIRYPLFSPML